MDEFRPRLNDDLTSAVQIITRAADCMDIVTQAQMILGQISADMTPCKQPLQEKDPEKILAIANAGLLVLINNTIKLEIVRAMIEDLQKTLEGDFKRRIADRILDRKLTLYGVDVS